MVPTSRSDRTAGSRHHPDLRPTRAGGGLRCRARARGPRASVHGGCAALGRDLRARRDAVRASVRGCDGARHRDGRRRRGDRRHRARGRDGGGGRGAALARPAVVTR
ncbi:MAG: hypothetical protein EP330_15770 [Deltaproteobacteria bacterium]|nr:MAG: hypothetical protein EP330_15770 [Deltaproteobacteria bacterium]